MSIQYNLYDNFISYSSLSVVKFVVHFLNFEKITVSCEMGMNFSIFNEYVTLLLHWEA